MSNPVRVLLRDVPPVLRGVLEEAAARHPSIELIDGSPALAGTGGKTEADIVLAVTPDPHQRSTARNLMCATHATRVALITPAAREMVIYDLASHPIAAVDLPASDLLDAVCRGLSRA